VAFKVLGGLVEAAQGEAEKLENGDMALKVSCGV